jgi:hypothetical protein
LSTVAQIISFAELIYPRTADISSANKIIIINQLIDEVYNKMKRIEWKNEISTSYSIADQFTYTLPTNCKPENLLRILVSSDVTGSVDNDTEWTEYQYLGVLSKADLDNGNYFYFIGDDTAVISTYGEPLATTNLEIKWYYHKTPAYVDSTDDTPEIEAKYHNLLKYGLIQMAASLGDNPQTTIADYWQKKCDEELASAIKNLQSKFASAPTIQMECEEFF